LSHDIINSDTQGIGVVVIGRNEGERLRRCLTSVCDSKSSIVYVDSGSTDDSINIAKNMSVNVVNLDMSLPFSAARARNAGVDRLTDLVPEFNYIQFVDGDCEVTDSWFATASQFLDENSNVAIVAGQLNERFPEASIYNRLGDLEWNFSKPGDVDAVGGIFMVKTAVFKDISGFNETVTAGEEPELCRRAMDAGWRIVRLDKDMAWHDLAMNSFGQWWPRQVRGGYGGLDVARRFGLKGFIRNSWRSRFWSAWLGVALISSFLGYWLTTSLLIMLWALQYWRIALGTWRGGQTIKTSLAYAWFTMLSFWPQMLGQIYYVWDKLKGRHYRLIEYKKNNT